MSCPLLVPEVRAVTYPSEDHSVAGGCCRRTVTDCHRTVIRSWVTPDLPPTARRAKTLLLLKLVETDRYERAIAAGEWPQRERLVDPGLAVIGMGFGKLEHVVRHEHP